MRRRVLHTRLVLGCLALCALTGQAQADDLEDLMSREAKAKDGKEDGKQDAEATGEDDADDFVEPDPWERPPKDEEPAPKAKPVARVATPAGDGRDLQIGLAIGYGFQTSAGSYAENPYGLGFGLRLGYTLEMGLFVGLGGSYFLGGTQDNNTVAGSPSAQDSNSISALTFGPEIGYDAWLGPVIVRPSLEIGGLITFQSNDTNFSGQTSSDTAMYLAPGVTVIVPMDEFYLGGDGRFVIPIGEGDGTFALLLVGGLRFDTDWF